MRICVFGLGYVGPSIFEKIEDIDEFVKRSDVVIVNRIDKVIAKKAKNKLYTRDVFSRD